MLPPSSRRKLLLPCLMAGLFFSVDVAAQATSSVRQQRFDEAFEQTFERYQLPGLAVAVIQDDRVIYQRTAGEREAGSGDSIGADTLFKIASNSKAMTTGLLARLVDAGKLRWDDPVTKYLPQFRMHDPWVSRHMQVRDLLLHNSGLGLGAGDLMLWPEPNDFSRDDIIAGLAHLKPTHSFRSHYAYDNLLYVVAGEVAAAAGGKPYDQLIREQLFEPLGMTRCQVGQWNQREVGNVAQPHARTAAGPRVVREDDDVVPDITSMAAGGIRCSLNDMVRWLRMWLDPQRQPAWLSEQQRREVWTAHMPMPVSQRMREWDNSHFSAYGYGWRLSDMDGVWKVAHTGTLSGMYSSVILLPDKRVGIVMLMNGEGEAARTVLGEVLAKHYTAPQDTHGVAGYAQRLQAEQHRNQQQAPLPDTSARQPVDANRMQPLLGTYRDPWFGEVSVCRDGGQVRWIARRSPRLRGRLLQVAQRQLIDWDDDSVDAEAWLTFDAVAAGQPPRMRMSAVDPDADFSYDYQDLDFERTGPCPE